MRPVRRRLLNLLTALSLLLCVAAVVLWLCSYVIPTSAGLRTYEAGGNSPALAVTVRGIGVRRGTFAFGRIRSGIGTNAAGPPVHASQWFEGSGSMTLYPAVRARPSGFGFDLALHNTPGEQGWIVGMPCWFVCFVTAATTTWRFAAARTSHRRSCRRNNVCVRCGYDLRATPARCPECGTAASVSTTA
jgi:hypothetical protein